MLTTYWSVSLALADIIKEQLKWHKHICWLLATLPSLILVLFNFGSFLEIMRIAGGLIAILIAFLVVPAFRRCRKENGKLLLPNALAGTAMQIVILLALLLMAVGSAVSI
jgi:amino acid permease